MDKLLYKNVTPGVSSDAPQVTLFPLGTVSPSVNGTLLEEDLKTSQIIPDMSKSSQAVLHVYMI